ncbi:hypothetical protein MYSTI_02011 [Myxococcus stipitatus DSM 14675]|uniref:Uncharacterized protein n=1 Tax=Myxococcus stipitatus (strain DSM 14675 / JCM 12634 / Mx s8) TaxID=1278073 RepID=L7U654_MYXSD|nr:hypothetical protein [Myxococcus stipitatus]AGC43340.1 hypothetical protein MYSTI_02011 [Myxococcus stipitatus DSM 14675]
MACGSVEEAPTPEVLEEQTSELRTCNTYLDCRSGCGCISGVCATAIGPPPPAGYCDVPPVRACTTGADCTNGCLCSNNVCVNDGGFSPPANCLLAPADSYESDNSHTSATSYVGTPQLNHNFHRAGDQDWVLGATNINMLMTVEIYNLRNVGGLRVELYAYNYDTRTLGTLLASTSSLVCSDIAQHCMKFKVSTNVAPGVYAVKVVDTRNVPAGSDWRPTPTYDLKWY